MVKSIKKKKKKKEKELSYEVWFPRSTLWLIPRDRTTGMAPASQNEFFWYILYFGLSNYILPKFTSLISILVLFLNELIVFFLWTTRKIRWTTYLHETTKQTWPSWEYKDCAGSAAINREYLNQPLTQYVIGSLCFFLTSPNKMSLIQSCFAEESMTNLQKPFNLH